MFASGESHEERVKVPVITSRREQYRQQIRRDNLTARFKLIRDAMIEQEELHSLHATLGQLAEDFSDCALSEALLILKGREDNAGFLLEAGRQRLEELVLGLLRKQAAKMSLRQATGLLTALGRLTYYSQATIQLLNDNIDFIDYLRERIAQLDLHGLEGLCHLRAILVFLLNTSSQLAEEYNNYLAESDLSQVINVQLARTIEIARQQPEEYARVAFDAREYCLRLYHNIVRAIDSQVQVPARLVGDVLRDEEYLLWHPEKTFLLLAEGMRNERFWPQLMGDADSKNFCAPICEAIDRIQLRCFSNEFLHDKHNQLTSEETRQFHAVARFLKQLFLESDIYEVSWSRLVENVLNGYMLGQFLIEGHQRKDSRQVVTALQLFLCIARTFEVTGQQLIVVRPADDPLELLKVLTDISLLKGQRTGPVCLEVLATLLRKDHSFLPAVMEFRVLEQLAELFESKEECVEIMAGGIELCTQLLASEGEAGKERRMLALMETKGIVQAISRLNDHKEKQVYMMAEIFAEKAGECGK